MKPHDHPHHHPDWGAHAHPHTEEHHGHAFGRRIVVDVEERLDEMLFDPETQVEGPDLTLLLKRSIEIQEAKKRGQ